MVLLNKIKNRTKAVLALADGTIFSGISIGIDGFTTGEVVFNTAMTGYQEILTDPSYAEQIVTLTYPHIGNVGINSEDQESPRVQAAGLVIRELSPIVSNWRSEQSLADYLLANNIVAIAEIDTRALTRKLRNEGAQHGCIMAGEVDEKAAIEKAKAFPGLMGKDLAIEVTCAKSYPWKQTTTDLEFAKNSNEAFHVVVVDFGVKQQILRILADHGCNVTVVPAKTSAKEILSLTPDGILLSNGPGDPAACDYAIDTIQELIHADVPLFGICLGFQLLALALGAKTVKMKFGHHGANHPVVDEKTKRVMITSQNHGFTVDADTLPDELTITHRSLFDGTLQGFQHKHKQIFGFQGHPEASPGPHDIVQLFQQFLNKEASCQNATT